MCEPFPYKEFEWIENVDHFDVNSIIDDASEDSILEVDLDYPMELHKIHRDSPFWAEYQVFPSSKLPKFMTTLYPGRKYIAHYRKLRQALTNGVNLVEIHEIFKFKQNSWLKSYMDLNTKLGNSGYTGV